MALNGTEWMQNPWNTTFSPFLNQFEDIVGVGETFYLFVICVITYALYSKSQDVTLTGMWMLSIGALSTGISIFIGATGIAIAFTIFASIGLAAVFIDLFFQR